MHLYGSKQRMPVIWRNRWLGTHRAFTRVGPYGRDRSSRRGFGQRERGRRRVQPEPMRPVFHACVPACGHVHIRLRRRVLPSVPGRAGFGPAGLERRTCRRHRGPEYRAHGLSRWIENVVGQRQTGIPGLNHHLAVYVHADSRPVGHAGARACGIQLEDLRSVQAVLADLHVHLPHPLSVKLELERPSSIEPAFPARRDRIGARIHPIRPRPRHLGKRDRVPVGILHTRISIRRRSGPLCLEADFLVIRLRTTRVVHDRNRQSDRINRRPSADTRSGVHGTCAWAVRSRGIRASAYFDFAAKPQTVRGSADVLMRAQALPARPDTCGV